MKREGYVLITETIEDISVEKIPRKSSEVLEVDVVKESNIIKQGNDFYIGGIFLQGNIKNRNGRYYPTDMLNESINRYIQTKVNTRRALGELNHPSGVDINLERVSHYITELKLNGNNGIGKAKILETPKGMIVRSIIEGGASIGVSTRGLGKLNENSKGDKIVEDFELVCVDVVADPSAPDAYVDAVTEGLKYYIDDATRRIGIMEDANQISEEMKLLNKIYTMLEEMKQNLAVLPNKSDDKKAKIFSVLNNSLDNLGKKVK